MEKLFTPVEICYIFAQRDTPLLETLDNHLSSLRLEGAIKPAHKCQISASSGWRKELENCLEKAPLLLLLTSRGLLATTIDWQWLMQRSQEKGAMIIPILLRPCDLQGTPFEGLQMLPRNGRAVTRWPDKDQAFVQIAQELRELLGHRHQPQMKTPNSSLPPIWQIPYARNPVFTGREDLLEALSTLLPKDASVILSQTQAISGLGGVGKTQLAIEYAYRNAGRYQSVFWVNAESRETVLAGYGAMAAALNLREKDEPDQQMIASAVRRWLQTHSDWLLILDNADDLPLVQPLLPEIYGGHILITTRSQITGRFAHCLSLEILSPEQGALLLLRRAKRVSEQAILVEADEQEKALARQISADLGGLPLALDQAGAYIEETGCGLAGYRRRYQQQEARLLAWQGHLTSDYPRPVATTWSLSFQQVEKKNPLAAQLLRFCAFLFPDAIPEELLIEALISGALKSEQDTDQGTEETSTTTDDQSEASMSKEEASWQIDDAMIALRAYSLIGRKPAEQEISVHRLVQAVLRGVMKEVEQQYWLSRVIIVVSTLFPYVEFENWERCARYLPQAQMCATWIARKGLLLTEGAFLLHEAGVYLHERAQYEQAEMLYKRALHISEQALGAEHPDTAATLLALARLSYNQGKYKQAEGLIKQALHIYEQTLGAEHPHTATTLHELARLSQAQGKYEQAKTLYERALHISEQTLGAEHPHTSTTLHELARLSYNQGKYEQAEMLYKRALHISEQALGAEHPDTAATLHELARLSQDQGKYEQAKTLYERSLHIKEQALGEEHPRIATTLHELARLSQAQGKYEQAEMLYKRALHIYEQALGAEHPHTATTLHALASLSYYQGKYEQAELLCKRALSIREQALGLEHPSTQKTREGFFLILQALGRDVEGEEVQGK